MSTLVLTSREQWFWDVERQVSVAAVVAGPEPDSRYARLTVGVDQPDGPMDLAARRRDGAPWTTPDTDQEIDVMIWQITDATAAWTSDGFVPPSPRPQAWCTVIGRR